jgi:tetratricopeptide (TPR) repeat protein
MAALFEMGELRRAETVGVSALAETQDLGDRPMELRVRLQLARLRSGLEPDAFESEATELTPEAIRVFEELGDDAGLAQAWGIVALLANLDGHPRAMEEAHQKAIEHSRRAGDRQGELEQLSALTATLFWGETPADEGIRRVRAALEKIKGHPSWEARMARPLAGFLAMQGRFVEARAILEESIKSVEDLGLKLYASTAGFFTAPLELLAGRPEAAERELRTSCEALEAIGEKGWYSSLAALLAESLYVQGKYDEAQEWVAKAERAAGGHDLGAQSDTRAIRGKLLARRGSFAEAESLAMEAVKIANRTGELNHEGDSYFDLAEVLALAGRSEESADALRRAIELWERKGNLVSTSKAKARLLRPWH